jgi:hypothetical protein
VTVAGTVGTWWVAPEESGFCSKGVCNSFIRTITTSFGSICFGSLLVAIVQALRAIAQEAQNNGDAAIFACIAQCILGCLASILEYFNKVRNSNIYKGSTWFHVSFSLTNYLSCWLLF